MTHSIQVVLDEDEAEEVIDYLRDGQEVELTGVDAEGESALIYVEPV